MADFGERTMKRTLLLYKILLLVAGSAVAAYGIMLALGAGFGGATLAVLWQGLAVTFGISLGEASFAVAVVMLLIALVYDKKQISVGTVVYQLVYSYFVDVFAQINVYPATAWLRFMMMCLGVVIFAAGTGAYAAADLGRGSYEALTFALAGKKHYSVKAVRTFLDALLVVGGVALGGQFGVCTLVTVLCSGVIIQHSAVFCAAALEALAGSNGRC